MARTRRIKRNGDAHYHLMSRTNDRRFLFSKGRVKGEIVSLLRKSAAFSGVRLEAWCVMDNHFHVVCKVVKPDGPVPEDEVIRRIGVLKGSRFAAELAEHWAELRSGGLGLVADAALGSWRARMHDVSQFAKTFKELVNIAYKAHVKAAARPALSKAHVKASATRSASSVNASPDSNSPSAGSCETQAYCGSIWSGRFKSTLIEEGGYLATCIRYVELNPVRAGMTRRAKDYAYSSANEAKPHEIGAFAGSVPDEALLRRVAQIGNGKIFGSYAFVMDAIYGFGSFFAGRPTPRPVFAGDSRGLSPRGEMGEVVLGAHASHGWRADDCPVPAFQ